jgi:hypothetical protein
MPPGTQPRRQVSDVMEPTPSYDFTDFQDVGPVRRDPIVSAAFIEAVAQSMGFSSDEDYRTSLHSIPMVCHVHV